MSDKIVFSIIAPAIRNNLYKTVYDSVRKRSRVSSEVIFVGPNPPKDSMPSNFKYIYTKVNPAQCVEIAARNSTGEYLIYISDDLLFPDRFLDRVYFNLSKLYMDKVLIGNRCQTNGVFYDKILTFERRCSNSPVVPWMPAFKREIWMKLGGIDRRFSGALCDLDMILRFYEIGYTPFVIPNNWGNEIRDGDINSFLCKKTEQLGRILNNKFWVKGGVVSKNRLEPVMSFSDKNILTEDQFLNTN